MCKKNIVNTVKTFAVVQRKCLLNSLSETANTKTNPEPVKIITYNSQCIDCREYRVTISSSEACIFFLSDDSARKTTK